MANDDAVDDLIRLAEEKGLDGDYRGAALIWRELRERFPLVARYYFDEMNAFRRCRAWREADAAGCAFYENCPDDFQARLEWYGCAQQEADFSTALARLEALKRRYPHELEFFAHEMSTLLRMYEFDTVRALLRAKFDALLAEAPARAWHMAYVCEEACDFEREAKAVRVAMRMAGEGDHRAALRRKRLGIAADNRDWISRHVPDLKLLSIGQNCLPWLLPNRWGLRPDAAGANWDMAFNLASFQGDKAAYSLANRFQDFHIAADFVEVAGPDGLPMFQNNRTNTGYFHERGRYWLADGGTRFHRLWELRIRNFLQALDQDGCVLFFALVGGGSLQILQNAVLPYLERSRTRLALVNFMQLEVPVPALHPHSFYAHIPYPRDYDWSYHDHYDSERGFVFEHKVAAFLMRVVRDVSA